MKIGIVCPYNLSKPGGVQQHVFEQSAELRLRGHDVKIITPKPRGELYIQDEKICFLGSSARFKTPQHTSVDFSISVDTEQIDSLLANERFDIIHIHEPLVPIMARQMLPRIACPVVATFHAAVPDTAMGKSIAGSISPFVKSIIKHIDAITAVSDAATSYISNYIDKDKIHFVPNGVDLNKYSSNDKKSGILYVGRLEKRKGVKHLLNAFMVCIKTDPKLKLTIAGDGPDRTKLEKLCVELGIAGSVKFLGQISEKQKQRLMGSARLFVSAALYGESFGIVLIEAMASGAVTVAGDNIGYSSVLTDVGSISLIDPEDSGTFANRMLLLYNNDGLRKLWLNWAQKDVKRYSYKNITDSYDAIYKKLVKS